MDEMSYQEERRRLRSDAGETEALREALDAGWNVLIGNIGEHGYRALFYRGSLFEAGDKVDATHRDLPQAVTTAARRALSQHVGGEG